MELVVLQVRDETGQFLIRKLDTAICYVTKIFNVGPTNFRKTFLLR